MRLWGLTKSFDIFKTYVVYFYQNLSSVFFNALHILSFVIEGIGGLFGAAIV